VTPPTTRAALGRLERDLERARAWLELLQESFIEGPPPPVGDPRRKHHGRYLVNLERARAQVRLLERAVDRDDAPL
jgi:hypothetical protein